MAAEGLLSAAAVATSVNAAQSMWRPLPVQFPSYAHSLRVFARVPSRHRPFPCAQNINQFLDNTVGYMAKTTAKGYKGPQETDLMPPVGIVDKLLVVAWVAILTAAVRFISAAAMVAEK